jgi:CDP-diacylglycerol--glycerol-3-phosphate 3-phosphatidyltransferase
VALRDLRAAPNVVSLARLALVPVAVLLLIAERRVLAAGVLVAMVLTDWLDGFIARRTRRVTALGKILDPVADKIAIDSILVALTLRGEFPAWAVWVIVARDVAILVGALAVARRTDVVPASIMIGKVTLVVLAAMTFAFVLDLEPLEAALLAAGVACVVASGVVYAAAMRAALRAGRAGA